LNLSWKRSIGKILVAFGVIGLLIGFFVLLLVISGASSFGVLKPWSSLILGLGCFLCGPWIRTARSNIHMGSTHMVKPMQILSMWVIEDYGWAWVGCCYYWAWVYRLPISFQWPFLNFTCLQRGGDIKHSPPPQKKRKRKETKGRVGDGRKRENEANTW